MADPESKADVVVEEDNEMEAFSKLESVDPRTTLTMINHFITTTTAFVNHLHVVAEQKLQRVHRNATRLDVKLRILEAKLRSIKGLEDIEAPAPAAAPAASQAASGAATVPGDALPTPPSAQPVPTAAAQSTALVVLDSNTCEADYKDYFIMLENQMPLKVVKLRCAAAGFNPDILDNRGKQVPVGGAGAAAAPVPPAGTPAGAVAGSVADAAAPVEPAAPAVPVLKLKDDPEYADFFKKLRFRIPAQHIKNMMKAAGKDPSILDLDPDSPSPNSGALAIIAE